MKKAIQRRRGEQRGSVLMEVLASMLIFSTGLLALAGLLASMTRAQTDAKLRADAANLTAEVIGIMTADRGNLAQYQTAPSTPCSYSRCAEWAAKVKSALPAASAQTTVDTATGRVEVSLTWAAPGAEVHRYANQTSIN
ncbi:type IV pilus modification PilV family protein [Ramlibacter humi]|uniref:Pilus assembly protein PilV n=1 Tax=Ramlibacter humi TaxID=2530451 RepID=A0A4Z0BFX7_9BURK|nr:pilus assembly protein PilV [Ramlibacter humi]TFY97034.1 pilus assembly protein PilV [Ramlibacter humi]